MGIQAIYCAAGNPRLARIAIDAGFLYGAQLPGTIYDRLFMADQDWKKPNREVYMRELAEHKPYMATVLDWERAEQLPEVLAWAEDAAVHVQEVLIVPKVPGGIAHLPRTIGGRPVRLAYSVPTKFGGTGVPAWEFYGWPVHLLGGAPHKQMALTRYLDVRSADGNYHHKMAMWCQFWAPGNATYAKDRYWPRLAEAGDYRENDAPYEAFRRSCENIMAAWQRLERVAA